MQLDQVNIRILVSTRKFLLFTIALGVIAATLVLAVLIPQAQEAMNTISKLRSETPKTDALRKKSASLDSITGTAEYAQIEVVDEALPSKKPLLELLLSIRNVSQTTGARVTKFELSPGLVASDAAQLQKQERQNNKGFDSLSVDLEIAGSFKQLQDFLLKVEQVSPFTTVTLMEINGQLTDTTLQKADQEFKAKLTTETYFFTQPIAVRVEAPLPVLATPEQNVLRALASFAPSDLPEQKEVTGGGLEDPFSVKKLTNEEALQNLLIKPETATGLNGAFPLAPTTPTPQPAQP